MTSRLSIMSRLEFVTVARMHWIRMFALAFALLPRTTVALVPLVLLLTTRGDS